MKMTVKTTGFADLDKALSEIEKTSTRKAVMRRALIEAAEPMARKARANAPVLEGDLQESVDVSTKLSDRQKRLHKKMFKNDKAAVEVFVGAGPLSSAHNQEFGNEHNAPQPFMRPAWDAEAMPTLNRLGTEMWSEIDKQAQRAARKAARDQQRG
ncbi:HK97-gp10 family putative phage morphogenesis protein [Pseudogemmobacter sonorensis]|uniref:HK97-gp10 family putative phage morphogenesis protein n=1 Tax=Pseudogemmobacter sonorensis TaxID=2989681 RepID=UPI00367449AF